MPRRDLPGRRRVTSCRPAGAGQRALRRPGRADATLQVNGRGEALVELHPQHGRPASRARLGGGERTGAEPEPAAGAVLVRLRRRLEEVRAPGVAHLPQPVPALRRPAPAEPRGGLQGAGRLLLGAAALAALLPMRGVAPFRPGHGRYELHVSHWSGPLPELEVSPNWTYDGRWQGLFGRLTYQGIPVHGFRTPSASRPEPYARFVYIDTFNSGFGRGWQRAAGHPRRTSERRLLLQLRAAGAAARLSRKHLPRAGERRAAPGHGDGPGRDTHRALGGRAARPLRPRARLAGSTRSSTGSSGRRTGSAASSADRIRRAIPDTRATVGGTGRPI